MLDLVDDYQTRSERIKVWWFTALNKKIENISSMYIDGNISR